ncbi:hypothetical protein HZB07_05045 [Candidatus Saganbacteria bacterium]|nr:hypothetical protein [Candidatus Saganbacteria bacterium]
MIEASKQNIMKIPGASLNVILGRPGNQSPHSPLIVRPLTLNGVRKVGEDTIPVLAHGFAVFIDPAKTQPKLWHPPEILAYDFTHHQTINSSPAPEEKDYRLIPGQTVDQLVKRGINIIAACNATSLWEASGILVVEGEIITRTAPAVTANQFTPLDGDYSVFSLDPDNPGIKLISLRQGNKPANLPCRLAVGGAVLIKEGKRVDHLITSGVKPADKPNELLWDAKLPRALTAIACTFAGKIVILALAGYPENPDGPAECRLSDLSALLHNFHNQYRIKDVVILGVGGDTQLYFDHQGKQTSFCGGVRRPPPLAPGSTLTRWGRGERPVSSIIYYTSARLPTDSL